MQKKERMVGYQISKYAPKNDHAGEWTSISDIGGVFHGEKLTDEKYLQVEDQYVNCCMQTISLYGIKKMQILGLEDYNHICPFYNYQYLNEKEIKEFIISCLREKYWGKLVCARMAIHFGYDYYLYFHVAEKFDCVEKIVEDNKLFFLRGFDPYWNGIISECCVPKIKGAIAKRFPFFQNNS